MPYLFLKWNEIYAVIPIRMTVLTFTLVVLAATFIAGLVGSITGLGGGVVIIPLLTIAFKVDIHYAIGTSLVSVIATSSGAAAAYVKEGYTNIRLGMFLEMATTAGAVAGTALLVFLPVPVISIIFGVVLIMSAMITLWNRHRDNITHNDNKLTTYLKLNGSFPDTNGSTAYTVRHVPAGFGLMMLAGILSSVLGIGSGAFKVLAMDSVMGVPFKVSTTTSNFMIGVTAVAGAVAYLHRGYIDPVLTFPVIIGTLLGATIGSRLLIRSQPTMLKVVFSVVILILAAEMIRNGIMQRP